MRYRRIVPLDFVNGERRSGLNLEGKRFGMLTVIKVIGHSLKRGNIWLCKCDCGNEVNIPTGDFKRSSHCGCMYINKAKTHDLTGTRIYTIWGAMKTRCSNKNIPNYSDYGGRGIRVSPKWENSFETFYSDMKDGYADDLQLDRIDNNKDYCKENCKWSNRYEQTRNKRNNQWFEKDGKRMVKADWARYFGVQFSTLSKMLDKHSFDVLHKYYSDIKLKKRKHGSHIH